MKVEKIHIEWERKQVEKDKQLEELNRSCKELQKEKEQTATQIRQLTDELLNKKKELEEIGEHVGNTSRGIETLEINGDVHLNEKERKRGSGMINHFSGTSFVFFLFFFFFVDRLFNLFMIIIRKFSFQFSLSRSGTDNQFLLYAQVKAHRDDELAQSRFKVTFFYNFPM
jgi:uncharacterized coiled-coil protein SlyX